MSNETSQFLKFVGSVIGVFLLIIVIALAFGAVAHSQNVAKRPEPNPPVINGGPPEVPDMNHSGPPDLSKHPELTQPVVLAQRDIVTVGRNYDSLVAASKELQRQDADAQARLQKATQAIFDFAGDPKHEKFDFDPQKLVLVDKPKKEENHAK